VDKLFEIVQGSLFSIIHQYYNFYSGEYDLLAFGTWRRSSAKEVKFARYRNTVMIYEKSMFSRQFSNLTCIVKPALPG
jgi:hypothetical protein